MAFRLKLWTGTLGILVQFLALSQASCVILAMTLRLNFEKSPCPSEFMCFQKLYSGAKTSLLNFFIPQFPSVSALVILKPVLPLWPYHSWCASLTSSVLVLQMQAFQLHLQSPTLSCSLKPHYVFALIWSWPLSTFVFLFCLTVCFTIFYTVLTLSGAYCFIF